MNGWILARWGLELPRLTKGTMRAKELDDGRAVAGLDTRRGVNERADQYVCVAAWVSNRATVGVEACLDRRRHGKLVDAARWVCQDDDELVLLAGEVGVERLPTCLCHNLLRVP